MTVVLESIPAGQVNFATIINNEYIEFTPIYWGDFKDYDLQIILTDGNMHSAPHKFKLTMDNGAPYFQTKLPGV